jgi:hypothetical protein
MGVDAGEPEEMTRGTCPRVMPGAA